MRAILKRMGAVQLLLKSTTGPLPTTEFHIVAKGEIVGMLQLRHRSSHSDRVPEDFASHVYYEIKPVFRGRGYAQEALKLVIQEAQSLGMKELVITCLTSNGASRRVIESSGAIFSGSCNTQEGELLKYKIDLTGTPQQGFGEIAS